MPRYEVVSGEIDGTNGNTPKKKIVWTRTPLKAAWRAHIIGGGKKITKISAVGYDDEARYYIFQAVTDRYVSFAIHVQEIWWYDRWKKLFT